MPGYEAAARERKARLIADHIEAAWSIEPGRFTGPAEAARDAAVFAGAVKAAGKKSASPLTRELVHEELERRRRMRGTYAAQPVVDVFAGLVESEYWAARDAREARSR